MLISRELLMALQRSLCLFSLVVAGGCVLAAEEAPPAPEWIDAPLSPDTWWEQSAAWKTEVYEIPLAAGQALEHMLRMSGGDMIVYGWTVAMDKPELLTAEFHGHTERSGTEPGTVMFYTQHKNGKENGTLRAPFTGVHGWYLNNESDQDIVVRLEVAGYFTE
jgi:hypothetical protein